MIKKTKTIPNSLRTWFKIHFLIDFLFGIPLIFAPYWTLNLFGFTTIDPFTTRLVGAALIGIGGVSLLANKEGLESYNTLLSLKIIWSLAAILAIIITIIEGAPQATWLFLILFAVFSAIWIYYKIIINSLKQNTHLKKS